MLGCALIVSSTLEELHLSHGVRYFSPPPEGVVTLDEYPTRPSSLKSLHLKWFRKRVEADNAENLISRSMATELLRPCLSSFSRIRVLDLPGSYRGRGTGIFSNLSRLLSLHRLCLESSIGHVDDMISHLPVLTSLKSLILKETRINSATRNGGNDVELLIVVHNSALQCLDLSNTRRWI